MKIVILASGSGTTFEAIARAEITNHLHTQILALIVDRDCQAIERAKNLDIPCLQINYKSAPEAFNARLLAQLTELNPDCVLLCGFLRKVPIEVIEMFKGRIFNSHPALLPRHGGLYGRKIHEAVIREGDTETGVTFHHVTENYDEGPIVTQKRVTVEKTDTAASIEEKVKHIEKEFLIEQLNKLSQKTTK
ncbi:MAG: phosphoribosylglycinamide formyltransferase [Bdellovibrionota bacterium]